MNFVTAETTQISLADLHDLSNDNFSEIVIEVRRRAEAGAGAYSGVQFLSSKESIACFKTVSDALVFIDNLHNGGVVQAIKQELLKNSDVETVTTEDVIEELQFSNNAFEPEEYIDKTGLGDPMNLHIIPHTEIIQPVAETKKATTDNTANTDIEV